MGFSVQDFGGFGLRVKGLGFGGLGFSEKGLGRASFSSSSCWDHLRTCDAKKLGSAQVQCLQRRAVIQSLPVQHILM